MKTIKDELQHIILGDEQTGQRSPLQATQSFLRRNARASFATEKKQLIKDQETAALLKFAKNEGLIYKGEINETDFISEGAEQRVYHFDDSSVIKTNASIFYEYWLDYFDSLLIHNFFFPSTAYSFLGFKLINNELHAVVKQKFIVNSESTDLTAVKYFLAHNGFLNTRNNDYINKDLGLIFEDLHDENVLSKHGILYFVDTIFYLTPDFYPLP